MSHVKSREGLLSRIRQAFRSEKQRAAGDTIMKRRPGATGATSADWEYQTRIGAMIRGDDWLRVISGRGQRAPIDAARRRLPVR